MLLIVLGLLRVRFAVRFWQKLYIVGLVYVVLLLTRLAVQLLH